MRQGWKRVVALCLSAFIMLPPAALAGESETDEVSNGVTVNFGKSTTVDVPSEKTQIASNSSGSFTLTLHEGKQLDAVTIAITKEPENEDPSTSVSNEIKLTQEASTGSFDGITAKIDQWPERSLTFQLTITTDALTSSYSANISCSTLATDPYSATIETSGDAEVSGSKSSVNRGSEISLSVVPDDGYRLKNLVIQYGTTKETLESGKSDWYGLIVTWNAEGESTISGRLYADLDVEAVIEEVPVYYTLTVDVDDGLELEQPSSRVTSVLQGDTREVRVEVNPGYLISDFRVQYGNKYASWATGQTFLTMGNDRIQVHEKSGEVWFYLPEIYNDTNIYFTADYDSDNLPIETDEGTRINIDTNCGDTVARGDDVEFYVSTTSDRYTVTKITLTIGDSTGTADPEDGEIRVGRKNYEIEDIGDGEYVVYVDNITEPVKLSATSSASTSVSRPSLTIGYSSHMKITKSVSSNRIDAGDDVTFYFTPNTNYQIDEITVRIGSNSRTVGADKTSIRVGSTTYQMSRNSNGVVSLYLTDIDQNVTVSGLAYYSKDSVTPTNTIRINTSSRSAFMNGYSDGTFRPENNMTRAEAVVMLYRMCTIYSEYDSTQSVYQDVPRDMWCAQEINTFANAGILDRTTYFYPNQYITRSDLTELLYRLSGSPSVSSSATRFSDISGISSSNAIRYAASSGWIDGYPDGTFRPYAYITRSEVAAMMTRVLNRTSGGSSITYTDVPYTHWAYRYIQLSSSYV